MEVNGYIIKENADLRNANFSGVNLCGASLCGADLRGADLRDANLRYANLHSANLHSANLRGANLHGANLRGANLHDANLHNANLRYANLDFSSGLPLSCNGLEVKLDNKLVIQMLFHITSCVEVSDVSKEIKELLLSEKALKIINKFHRTEIDRIDRINNKQ